MSAPRSGSVAVLDFETTGVDVETARIVTAFFGILDPDGKLIAEYDFMVKPDGYIIPDEASAIHGVSTEQALAEGAPLADVVNKIGALIKAHCKLAELAVPLVGHNISYDLTVFDREAARVFPTRTIGALLDGVFVLDSLVLDKHYDRYRKGKRTLIVMAEHYGVELSEEEAHGARADAIASGRIVQVMGRQNSALRHTPLRTLQMNQVQWKREQAASLQVYFRTKADPPQPDAIVNGEWPYIQRPAEGAEQ